MKMGPLLIRRMSMVSIEKAYVCPVNRWCSRLKMVSNPVYVIVSRLGRTD